jgi:hypothetical protein
VRDETTEEEHEITQAPVVPQQIFEVCGESVEWIVVGVRIAPQRRLE